MGHTGGGGGGREYWCLELTDTLQTDSHLTPSWSRRHEKNSVF